MDLRLVLARSYVQHDRIHHRGCVGGQHEQRTNVHLGTLALALFTGSNDALKRLDALQCTQPISSSRAFVLPTDYSGVDLNPITDREAFAESPFIRFDS